MFSYPNELFRWTWDVHVRCGAWNTRSHHLHKCRTIGCWCPIELHTYITVVRDIRKTRQGRKWVRLYDKYYKDDIKDRTFWWETRGSRETQLPSPGIQHGGYASCLNLWEMLSVAESHHNLNQSEVLQHILDFHPPCRLDVLSSGCCRWFWMQFLRSKIPNLMCPDGGSSCYKCSLGCSLRQYLISNSLQSKQWNIYASLSKWCSADIRKFSYTVLGALFLQACRFFICVWVQPFLEAGRQRLNPITNKPNRAEQSENPHNSWRVSQ